jgi:hypothetical protein
MFDTPNGQEREDVRQLSTRTKQYRARAAEHVTLAESALTQEVRDHHQEVARRYRQLAEKESHLPSDDAVG